MAALPLSPENERELATLRARAYGPDADISDDPAAIMRLNELETMARATPGDDPSFSDADSDTDSAPVGAATAAALTAHRRTPRSGAARVRRAPAWILAGAAASLGIIVGLALSNLLESHPDATLREDPTEGATVDFAAYDLPTAAATRFDLFHGLEVWSARADDGSLCLLVTMDGEWAADGCAPPALDPIAEVMLYPDARPIEGLDLPIGSVVRFVLRQGVVQVWIDEHVERT